MGAILDLNQISDQSILIDCLHYVVASKYNYFRFWIFHIISARGLDPFFYDHSIKRFIPFIKKEEVEPIKSAFSIHPWSSITHSRNIFDPEESIEKSNSL